jgi:hypothetical protein
MCMKSAGAGAGTDNNNNTTKNDQGEMMMTIFQTLQQNHEAHVLPLKKWHLDKPYNEAASNTPPQHHASFLKSTIQQVNCVRDTPPHMYAVAAHILGVEEAKVVLQEKEAKVVIQEKNTLRLVGLGEYM